MTGVFGVNCHAANITNGAFLQTSLEIVKKKQIPDDVNWEVLVKKANEEAMSEWSKSESAIEKDIKRNLDKWGNKGKEPLTIKNDSIIYSIYYSEQVFDMLSRLDNLKERFGEVLLYTKLYNSVKILLGIMAQHHKDLYILMLSNEKQRFKIIPFSEEEYKIFLMFFYYLLIYFSR